MSMMKACPSGNEVESTDGSVLEDAIGGDDAMARDYVYVHDQASEEDGSSAVITLRALKDIVIYVRVSYRSRMSHARVNRLSSCRRKPPITSGSLLPGQHSLMRTRVGPKGTSHRSLRESSSVSN